jgi:hypothetical protein
MRRSIFGSKNFRNILLALAEINLKSFGVRLIGNDELCHWMYLLYRGSSIEAFCHGKHPEFYAISLFSNPRHVENGEKKGKKGKKKSIL